MNRIVISLSIVAGLIFTASCGPAANNSATNNRPANAANNAAAPSTANAEADIKKVMTEIAGELAKNDPAVAKHYSEDYHLVTPDGVDQTKAQRMADMQSGATKFDSFAYENVNVRTYGDTAVAITTVKARGVVNGKPRTTDMRATLVFRKMGDTWKIVSGQATPITASAAKPDDKAPANTAASNSNAVKPPPPANK